MKKHLDIELENEDYKKLHSKIIRYDYKNIMVHSIEYTKNDLIFEVVFLVLL